MKNTLKNKVNIPKKYQTLIDFVLYQFTIDIKNGKVKKNSDLAFLINTKGLKIYKKNIKILNWLYYEGQMRPFICFAFNRLETLLQEMSKCITNNKDSELLFISLHRTDSINVREFIVLLPESINSEIASSSSLSRTISLNGQKLTKQYEPILGKMPSIQDFL